MAVALGSTVAASSHPTGLPSTPARRGLQDWAYHVIVVLLEPSTTGLEEGCLPFMLGPSDLLSDSRRSTHSAQTLDPRRFDIRRFVDVVTSNGLAVNGLAPGRRYSPSLQGCKQFFFGRGYMDIWIVTNRLCWTLLDQGQVFENKYLIKCQGLEYNRVGVCQGHEYNRVGVIREGFVQCGT